MNQISIALEMLMLLKIRNKISKAELAQRFQISIKQVQRIKQQLEQLGYNIQVTNGRYGGYQLITQSPLTLTDLSPDQKSALINASSYLLNLKHPLITQDFISGYIKCFLTDANALHIETATRRKLIYDPQAISKIINILNLAILKKYRVKLTYHNQKEYFFEPYILFNIDQDMYVCGYLKFDDIRTFKLNRIQTIQLLEETFITTKSFNLETILDSQGFKQHESVILKATIFNRNYLLEYQIAHQQIFSNITSNQFDCELTFLNQYAMKGFILECGSDIYIKEPLAARQLQLDTASKILSLYNSN